MTSDTGFEKPPVREVSLTILFDSVRTLSTLHLAALRLSWAADLPHVEELAPLLPWASESGSYSFLGQTTKWPMPACVFSNEDRSRELLIQDDRFSLTWKFTNRNSYPSFVTLHRELLGRYREFVSSIVQADNPEPNARRVLINYVNILEGIDSEDVAAAVIEGRQITKTRSLRSRDAVSIRKHYCPTEENEDVTILLGVDPGTAESEDDDSASEHSVSALVFEGAGTVEKEQDPVERLLAVHEAVVGLFTTLLSDELRAEWGERHG